jgi:hypothetical protein
MLLMINLAIGAGANTVKVEVEAQDFKAGEAGF